MRNLNLAFKGIVFNKITMHTSTGHASFTKLSRH